MLIQKYHKLNFFLSIYWLACCITRKLISLITFMKMKGNYYSFAKVLIVVALKLKYTIG